jgi:hypothetical protein
VTIVFIATNPSNRVRGPPAHLNLTSFWRIVMPRSAKLLLLVPLCLLLHTRPAAAERLLVQVTVVEFENLDAPGDKADPYAILTIAGGSHTTKRYDDRRRIKPDWTYAAVVDAARWRGSKGDSFAAGSIDLGISVKDYDSTSKDDTLDVHPAKGRRSLSLRLTVDLDQRAGPGASGLRDESGKSLAVLKRTGDAWDSGLVRSSGAGDDNRSKIAYRVQVLRLRSVKLTVDTLQPQTDGWSCGPNSAARFLRFHRKDVSYAQTRNFTRHDGNLIALIGAGTPPSALIDTLQNWRKETRREEASNIGRVIALLQQKKPVIALISTGKERQHAAGIYIGTTAKLHYIVLNGYDPDTERIHFVDTVGGQKSMTRAEFEDRWAWHNHFTGAYGETQQGALAALGFVKRTIFH